MNYIYTSQIQKTFFSLILIIGSVIYTISEHKQPQSSLVFFETQYLQDFLLQSLSILKFTVLIVVVLSWIYVTKISRYNVYLCIRCHPIKVIASQFIVLVLLTYILLYSILSILVIVWSLYPSILTIKTVTSLFITSSFWVLYYHLLCLLMNVLFHHMFALVIPLFGYAIGLIEMGMITSESDFTNQPNLIQVIWPDLLFYKDVFRFRYSPYVHITALLLCALTIYKILQKKDYDLFL